MLLQTKRLSRLNKFITFLFIVSFSSFAFAQNESKEMWKIFSNVKFKDHYVKDYASYAQLLIIDNTIKAYDGRIITIKGYNIPVQEKGVFVISKFPYAQCFFCGGAGIESIVEVMPTKEFKHKKLKLDQIITFRGRLKLNDKDWLRMPFILENAELITN